MTWPTARTFPDLGEVAPGEQVEAEVNPHPAFFAEATPTVAVAETAQTADSAGVKA